MKVLVIEDWDQALKMLHPTDQQIMKLCAKYNELKDVVRIEAKVDRLYDQMPEFTTVLLTKQPKGWSAEIQDSFGFKEGDPLIVLVAKKEDG